MCQGYGNNTIDACMRVLAFSPEQQFKHLLSSVSLLVTLLKHALLDGYLSELCSVQKELTI